MNLAKTALTSPVPTRPTRLITHVIPAFHRDPERGPWIADSAGRSLRGVTEAHQSPWTPAYSIDPTYRT